MALKMPGPAAFALSYVFHLDVRVPKGLAERIRGTVVTLPVDRQYVTTEIGDKAVVSLPTKTAREARTLRQPSPPCRPISRRSGGDF